MKFTFDLEYVSLHPDIDGKSILNLRYILYSSNLSGDCSRRLYDIKFLDDFFNLLQYPWRKKLLNLDGERKFVRTLLTFRGTWQGNKLKTSKKDFLDTFCFMNIPTGCGDQ